jgi:hypothetical protein
MKDDARTVFAQQIIALIQKKKTEFTNYETNGDTLKVRIKIVDTPVAITIAKTRRTDHHSSVEPDPRMFGDTAEVTANAMRDWYPGKTNSYSETKTKIVIKAEGLPLTNSHEETYRYTQYSYRDDAKIAVDNILQTIETRHRESEFTKETQNKTHKA